jgi:fructose-bisphosphate aldolase, class II
MPVADYATYSKMLDRARTEKFAYPAVNVTSLTTANAVLKGLAESRSDGIIQVSTGGGAFASGAAVKDMALGAMSIAEHVHRVADRYPIHVALHTDHCQADKLDAFVLPLVEETERRRASGRPNLFNAHMFDGSALPLKDNLDIAVKLHERFRKTDLLESSVHACADPAGRFAAKENRPRRRAVEQRARLHSTTTKYVLNGHAAPRHARISDSAGPGPVMTGWWR